MAMDKYFNTTGPCNLKEHYMLPAQARCGDLQPLISRGQYFVIHAARQTGKTTLLCDLADELNASGDYHALYCTLESIQKITDPRQGIPAIVRTLASAMRYHAGLKHIKFAKEIDPADFNNVLKIELADLCGALDKPLVLLFDEVDCLSGDTLITFLRSLRDGYVTRSRIPFVHSLALVGMRNIRDYKAKVREDSQTLGSASPFNIVAESLTIRNFTRDEVAELYAQHTEATGQEFPPEIVDSVFDWTEGQPWLVNAIALEVIEKILGDDYTAAITTDHIDQAVQTIIMRRDTHIDSLLERLKEARVRKIIEPVILGEKGDIRRLSDDYEYVRDLGLIREERHEAHPANRIYAEIIGRVLSYDAQRVFSLIHTM